MRRTTAWLGAAMVLLSLAGPAAAAAATLEARVGYFFPASEDFRDIYKGGLSFGADLTVPVWKSLCAWAGLDYFNKTGELTYTQEPTTLRVLPLFAGLKLQPSSGNVRPYAAAAAGYFLFKESSAIGTASGQELGLLAQAGLLVKIKGRTFIDFHGRYTSCVHTVTDPEAFSVQLGGFQGGIGLALRF